MKKIITSVVLGAMLSALNFPAEAQQSAKVWKIGVLVSMGENGVSGGKWGQEPFNSGAI
jgi:hypothetical protein